MVICSDGLDRGDPDVLATAMERLSRLCYRIVWLNPHKGARGFRPSTLGMMVAAPHIDLMLSGHDLSSLEELAALLPALQLGAAGAVERGIEAEGDRVMTREEVVELADAVAASNGIATGIGTTHYGAQLIVEAAAGTRRSSGHRAVPPAAARAGLPPRPSQAEAISEDEDEDDPMIRLGSLAGYPFEGPRLLGGWTPPPVPAVYAILYKPEPEAKPEQYAVIYVGHADDLSAERFPFRHPRAAMLGAPRGLPLEGVHLHLPGARRLPAAPRADRAES